MTQSNHLQEKHARLEARVTFDQKNLFQHAAALTVDH